MLNRRDYLLGSIDAGIVALGGDCIAAPGTEPIRAALKQTVGTHDKVAGTVAVVIDEGGTSRVAYGSSGIPNVALDPHTVFEIGSITKVLTALMLADMAARGEVAIDDPVAKYLPPSLTLHERGRPITLLDLATYNAGLPRLPGNLPPAWWANPNPFADYTVDKLFDFVSNYMPKYGPATHFVYSSLGFGLLGVALARRAGKSYQELLIERVCDPLGLAHTRITLSADTQRHLAQAHDLSLKPTPLWDFLPALQGAGAVRASVNDVTVFLKACMGLVHAPLRGSLARLLKTRRPTNLAGTDAALGWFISSDGKEEIAWKSGLTGGSNSFIGFSTQRRRGALVLSNFVWQPLDVGTTAMGMKMIKADFDPGDLGSLYLHD
jgi:D-alanyl-D-alanine-carboxypeptidase/D-alanyl-D-alanine-endopeptidase